MSGAEWIAARLAEASDSRPSSGLPTRLLERVRELAAEHATDAAEPSRSLVKGAGEVLTRLLRDGQTARDGALELLAADALVTYAFEAQADSVESLEERCEWAMTYLSRLAEHE